MKISKLKAPLITVSCFVVALCSEIQCMDNHPDLEKVTSHKARNSYSENFLDSLKPEIDNSLADAMLPFVQDEDEKAEASWALYVAFPIKAVINGTYNIVDFAIKNPTQATIYSLLIAAQFMAVAAECNCILLKNAGWSSACGAFKGELQTLGMFHNQASCKGVAEIACGYEYVGCF